MTKRLKSTAYVRILNRVIRSRLLNPQWIEGMREHDYKGAFERSRLFANVVAE